MIPASARHSSGKFFTSRVTAAEAEEYFNLTPESIAPGAVVERAPDPDAPIADELVDHFADLASIFGLPGVPWEDLRDLLFFRPTDTDSCR
jgi:hypothetical protein